MAAAEHSLWHKVWRPFLILFLITAAEFIVAFTVPKGGLKISLFFLMTIAKAFYITAYFMHMKFEKVSLAYIIISPLILLMALFFALWYEGVKLFSAFFWWMKGGVRALLALLIFLLPLGLWLVLRTGKTHYKQLPKLGPSEVRGPGDTVWHRLPDFALVQQDSLPFTADSLRGWVHVADYFFTRCPGICPQLSRSMQRIQAHLAGSSARVRLVSYTVDPAHDTPPVLREYAARYQADLSRWTFVTGPETTLYRLAVKGYLIPVDKANDTTEGELGYIHSDMLVLVDPELRIRGFYSGLDSLQVAKLLDDLNLLLLEYRPPS